MSYSFSLVLYEHIPSLQEGNLVLLFVFPEKDIPAAKYRSYQRLVQSPLPVCSRSNFSNRMSGASHS